MKTAFVTSSEKGDFLKKVDLLQSVHSTYLQKVLSDVRQDNQSLTTQMRTPLIVSAVLVAASVMALLATSTWLASARTNWERYHSDSFSALLRIIDGFSLEKEMLVQTPETRRVEIHFDHRAPQADYAHRADFPLDLSIDITRDGKSVYHADYPPGWGVFSSGGDGHGVSFYPFRSKPGPYHVSLRVHRSTPELDAGNPRLNIAPDENVMKELGLNVYFSELLRRSTLWVLALSLIALVVCVVTSLYRYKSSDPARQRTGFGGSPLC